MGSDAIVLPGTSEVACPQRAAMGRLHDAGRMVAAWASSRRAGAVEDTATAKSDLTSCLAPAVPAVAGSDSYFDDNLQLRPRSAARVFKLCTADVCAAKLLARRGLDIRCRRLHAKCWFDLEQDFKCSGEGC